VYATNGETNMVLDSFPNCVAFCGDQKRKKRAKRKKEKQKKLNMASISKR
tara:strand:+ start:2013 stop:2162 length:150 start_codon:yes stop_codon:yes gene_type:complete